MAVPLRVLAIKKYKLFFGGTLFYFIEKVPAAIKLQGVGGKALVALPLRKKLFFAAFLADMSCELPYNYPKITNHLKKRYLPITFKILQLRSLSQL